MAYCFLFSSLAATIGDLADSLELSTGASVTITVVSILAPLLANLTDIRIFRKIELTCGFVKIVLAVVFNISMMAINGKAPTTLHPREPIFHFKRWGGWFVTMCIAILRTSFS